MTPPDPRPSPAAPVTLDLFDAPGADPQPATESLAPGAMLLRGVALADDAILLAAIEQVLQAAPLRHLVTPGGYTMSVAMSNCGRLGWVSDRRGYRYEPVDPTTGQPWPPLPGALRALAQRAATAAGFAPFEPDACLVNRYEPSARLSLHQDKDELDFTAPIVSVSLGLPATFLFGGLARSDKPARYRVVHGDVVVWGGPSRLAYHGVAPLADGHHPLLGRQRLNLTFRKVLAG
jgi:alkylated DNA repair protein (DNA oxidative demethylase)